MYFRGIPQPFSLPLAILFFVFTSDLSASTACQPLYAEAISHAVTGVEARNFSLKGIAGLSAVTLPVACIPVVGKVFVATAFVTAACNQFRYNNNNHVRSLRLLKDAAKFVGLPRLIQGAYPEKAPIMQFLKEVKKKRPDFELYGLQMQKLLVAHHVVNQSNSEVYCQTEALFTYDEIVADAVDSIRDYSAL